LNFFLQNRIKSSWRRTTLKVKSSSPQPVSLFFFEKAMSLRWRLVSLYLRLKSSWWRSVSLKSLKIYAKKNPAPSFAQTTPFLRYQTTRKPPIYSIVGRATSPATQLKIWFLTRALSREVPQRTWESSYLGLLLTNLPPSALQALHVEAPPTCSPKRCRFAVPCLLFLDTPYTVCRSDPTWDRTHPPVESVCSSGFWSVLFGPCIVPLPFIQHRRVENQKFEKLR